MELEGSLHKNQSSRYSLSTQKVSLSCSLWTPSIHKIPKSKELIVLMFQPLLSRETDLSSLTLKRKRSWETWLPVFKRIKMRRWQRGEALWCLQSSCGPIYAKWSWVILKRTLSSSNYKTTILTWMGKFWPMEVHFFTLLSSKANLVLWSFWWKNARWVMKRIKMVTLPFIMPTCLVSNTVLQRL